MSHPAADLHSYSHPAPVARGNHTPWSLSAAAFIEQQIANRSNKKELIKFMFDSNKPITDKEKQILAHVNPHALDFVINKETILSFEHGFRTINDLHSYTFEHDCTIINLCEAVNSSLSTDRPLIELGSIRDNRTFIGEVDLDKINDYLLSMGFVRKCFNVVSDGSQGYYLFTDKNLPHMCVNLTFAGKMAVEGNFIAGLVSEQIYLDIEELLKDSYIENKPKDYVLQLNGYGESCGETVGKISSIELTADMDYSLQEFYPWININIQEYFKEFFNSRSNVLILIGPPGTGKSTLIRTIIRDLTVASLIVYKPEVINDTNFIQTCQKFLKNSPERHPIIESRSKRATLIKLRGDNTVIDTKSIRKAVIVEDADILMASRDDGNMKMSEILNATSGIATDVNSKFILSTNLRNTEDIDPALMRPGRCFDILCFRELTAAEAMKIRALKGMPEIEFVSSRKYKLAEVLNDTSVQSQVDPVVKPRFGFCN